eukprot:Rmarinus@m.2965
MGRPTEIHALLQSASKEKDVSLLKSAYETLCREYASSARLEHGVYLRRALLEIFVTSAETALDLELYNIAQEAIETFLITDPPEDQYLCRAFYARARCEGHEARGMKGNATIKHTLAAIASVMKGLDIAEKDTGRYAFLIYNASCVYWEIVRPLLSAGKRTHAVASMTRLVTALEQCADAKIDRGSGTPVWRLRFHIALVTCLDETNSPAEATKAALRALGIARAQAPSMEEACLMVYVHVSRTNEKGALALKAEGKTRKMRAAVLLQFVRSGIVKDQAALDTLKEAEEVATNGLPGDESSAGGPDTDWVGEVAWCAAKYGFFDVAARNYDAAIEGRGLRGRVLGEFARALVLIHNLGHSAKLLTKNSVETRLEVLNRLQQQLVSVRALRDEAAMHDFCILLWNLSLPLLQNNLRPHARTGIMIATNALEDLKSPLTYLRCLLQLEGAKCDIMDDLLQPAIKKLENAYSMDYVVPLETEKYGMDRPLDRYLVPLLEKAHLRGNIYSDPDTDEEHTLHLIDQAEHATSAGMRSSFLQPAIKHLNSVSVANLNKLAEFTASNAKKPQSQESTRPTSKVATKKKGADPPPAETPGGPEVPSELRAAFEKEVTLWGEIAKIAWQQNDRALAKEACESILKERQIVWDKIRQKHIIILSAKSHYILAEAALMQLYDAGYRLGSDVAEEHPDAITSQSEALENIAKGIDLGASVAERWLVMNGGIMLWNYHLKDIEDENYVVMLEPFAHAYGAMIQLDLQPEDAIFICSFAHVLAMAYEHQFLIDTFLAQSPDAQIPCFKELQSSLQQVSNAGANEDLKSALAALQAAAKLAKPMHKKDVLACIARVCRYMGSNPPAETESASKVMLLIESAVEVTDVKKKTDAIKQAMQLLSENPKDANPELWSKLAQAAYDADAHSTAMECSRSAVAIPPPDGKTQRQLAQIRWYSLAECVWGQAALALTSDKFGQQDSITVDNLRQIGMTHFVEAAMYGARALSVELVDLAMRHFWSAGLHFAASSVTRRVLYGGLKKMLAVASAIVSWAVTKKGVKLDDDESGSQSVDAHLHVLLYKILFECLRDREQWDEGVRVANEALKVLPRSQHKVVWESKIFFSLKLGRNVSVDLARLKDAHPIVQARVWQVVAREAKEPVAQLEALQKAVEVSEGIGLEHVESVLEYARWLIKSGFPQDAEDQMLHAIDVLLDASTARGNDDDDDHSQRSNSSLGSIHSASRPSRKKRPTATSQSMAEAGTGGGGVSSEKQNSRRASISSQVSGVSSDSPPTKKSQDAPLEIACPVLERVVRVFTMLASVSPSPAQRFEFVTTAHYYVCQLWSKTLTAMNLVALKNPQPPSRPPSRGDIASAPATGRSKTAAAPVPIESGPPWMLPRIPEEWIDFSIPATLRELMKTSEDHNAINRTTVTKPELTVHYFLCLADLLMKSGQVLKMIPVLRLAEVVGEDVLGYPMLGELVRSRIARVFTHLMCTKHTATLFPSANTLAIPEAFRLECADAARRRVEIKTKSKSQEELNSTEWKVGREDEHLLRPLEPQQMWVTCGVEAIAWGEMSVAKALLEQARTLSTVYDDGKSYAWATHGLAEIALRHDAVDLALHLECEAQQYKGDAKFWTESTIVRAGCLVARRRFGEAENLLKRVIAVLSQLGDQNVSLGWEVHQYCAKLERCRAEVMFDEATDLKRFGKPYEGAMETALQTFKQAEQISSRTGGGPESIFSLLRQADCALTNEVPEGSPHRPNLLIAYGAARAAEQRCLMMLLQLSRPGENVDQASEPVRRHLARVKLLLGELELRFLYDEKLFPVERYVPSIPNFPETLMGDDAAVREFLKPSSALPQADPMPHDTRAALYASASLSLLSSGPLRVRAESLLGCAATETALRTAEASPQWPAMQPKVEELMSAEALVYSAEGEPMDAPGGSDTEGVSQGEGLSDSGVSPKRNGPKRKSSDVSRRGSTASRRGSVASRKDSMTSVKSGQSMKDKKRKKEKEKDKEKEKEKTKKGDESARDSTADPQSARTAAPEEPVVERRVVSHVCLARHHLHEAISQACESPVRLADNDVLVAVTRAADALIELYGPAEPAMCARAIAIAQGSNARAFWLDRMLELLGPSAKERIAIRETRRLMQAYDAPEGCRRVTAYDHYLRSKPMAPRLDIDGNFSQHPGDGLPEDYRVVVVRYSELRKRAYAGLIRSVPPNQAAAGKQTTQEAEGESVPNCLVSAIDLSPHVLRKLQESVQSFRTRISKLLMFMRRPGASEERMALAMEPAVGQQRCGYPLEGSEVHAWNDIVSEMLTLFGPLLEPFVQDLGGDETAVNVVLVLDPELLILPWEVLPQVAHAFGLSRDLGFEVLKKRLEQNVQTVKYKHCHYILDPLNQDRSVNAASGRLHSSYDFFSRLKEAGWTGVSGRDHIPTPREWERHLSTGPAFYFYGLGRFLAHLPSSAVASSDLTACHFAAALCEVATEESQRQQASIDADKSTIDRAMETPEMAAGLLSLRGVTCVMLNQFDSDFAYNEYVAKNLPKECQHGETVGSYLQNFIRPPPKMPEAPAEDPTLSRPSSRQSTPRAPAASVKDERVKSASKKDKPKDSGKKGPPPVALRTPRRRINPNWSSPLPVYAQYNTVIYGLPHLALDRSA